MTKQNFHKIRSKIKTIYPGEYYVTRRNELVSTVLGSCISVCLFDSVNCVSGMNHFMLPKNSRFDLNINSSNIAEKLDHSSSLRYGVTAMEILINKMISMGGERKYIKAKVFGGGNVLPIANKQVTVGEQNILFILSFLEEENIEILSKDLGKNFGRRILLFTHSNKVFVKQIPMSSIIEDEVQTVIPHAGEVDLFV